MCGIVWVSMGNDNAVGGREQIWNGFGYEDILNNTPNGPLPECNRGSWFCPVADERAPHFLDEILTFEGIDRVYDLGAGDCRFAVDMDRRGYEVIAFETLPHIAKFGLSHFPDNDVQLVCTDYYSQWPKIKTDRAAFVALGRLNQVPGEPDDGIVIDGMAVPDLWTYKRYLYTDTEQ